MLDGVLGLLDGPEHVAAEGEDGALVTVVGHLEGPLRACTDLLDETLVGGQTQQSSGKRSGLPAI